MSKISMEADPLSSIVLKFFLLVQSAAILIVVGLSLSGFSFWAASISLLTLLAFLALLLWLYARYRELPRVRQKRDLMRLARRFQKIVQAESRTIEESMKQRELLSQAKDDEIQQALTAFQAEQIEKSLAAHTDETVLPAHSLQNTLPPEQLEAIRKKYRPLQDRIEADEWKALASKQLLEHELVMFRPRLELLASLTFWNYLTSSLAPYSLVAGLLACGLIGAQVVSSVGATASSIVGFPPQATATPSQTLTPSLTPQATDTRTRTATATPPSTATPAPSQTRGSVTATATLTSLPNLRPSDTPIIPISGLETNAICDPAYPGVCIPPPPPDLDCGEIPYKGFQVLPPDPHRFDRDKDGIGCES